VKAYADPALQEQRLQKPHANLGEELVKVTSVDEPLPPPDSGHRDVCVPASSSGSVERRWEVNDDEYGGGNARKGQPPIP
jgi:hypothetical protein